MNRLIFSPSPSLSPWALSPFAALLLAACATSEIAREQAPSIPESTVSAPENDLEESERSDPARATDSSASTTVPDSRTRGPLVSPLEPPREERFKTLGYAGGVEQQAQVVGGLAATGTTAGGGDAKGDVSGIGGMGKRGTVAPAAPPYGSSPAPMLKREQARRNAAYKQPVSAPEFNTESYSHITDNAFREVAQEPLSTFSIDVDTASYANVRRFITDGALPPQDAVRIEEMLNYFSYDYPEPQNGAPFAAVTEVAPCPWAEGDRLVHIGIQGRHITPANLPPRNLVFLVDVSGSMQSPDKLPLVKASLSLLASQLTSRDWISLVVYAGSSGLVLPPTPGNAEGVIQEALGRLEAGGSTAGAAGIQLAYQTARNHFQKGAINRVILATDGDFNVGTSSEGDLVRLIEKERESGVFLTVLGFGRGNLKDSMMEKLADKGNGNYAYIDSLDEGRKALGKEAGASLVTLAKDVKIQVEWNPAEVASYRLIGYENRILANEDFNDDRKDAGEIGAGHSVTALYQVTPSGKASPSSPKVDPLRYQAPRSASAAAGSGEMMTLKLRYKAPDGDTSQLASFPVRDSGKSLAATSEDYRFSAAVAALGMILRDSSHRGSANFALVESLARGSLGRDEGGYRREFLTLLDGVRRLSDKDSGSVGMVTR